MHFEHKHDSCDGPDSPCHEDIEPWCRRPRGTPNYSLRLLGEPLHRFSRLPSQASARSPRDDLAGCPGTLQDLPAPGALRTRCGIEFCGSSGRVRRFRCVSHQLPHGLIPTLPPLRRISRDTTDTDPPIRSAVRRSEHPSYHPLSDSRPVLYRQHTPHQQPPPRQALLLRPYDTAPRSRGEYAPTTALAAMAGGSSPLSRGILLRGRTPGRRRRIIPALAGNTFFAAAIPSAWRDHPRSRGEYPRKSDLIWH